MRTFVVVVSHIIICMYITKKVNASLSVSLKVVPNVRDVGSKKRELLYGVI